MTRARSFCLLLALAALLSGCLGGGAPERILRLEPRAALHCADAAVPAGSPGVLLREFTSLEGLDRQAVLVADGPVITPAIALSWEGRPTDLARMMVGAALACRQGIAAHTELLPRPGHAASVGGAVEAFEVHSDQGPAFVTSLRLTLTGPGGRQEDVFGASAPMQALTAAQIATAAQAALGEAASKGAAWVAAHLAEVERKP